MTKRIEGSNTFIFKILCTECNLKSDQSLFLFICGDKKQHLIKILAKIWETN